MKVLILCVALSVWLSVTEASPVKTEIPNTSDSSDDGGSSDLQSYEKNVSTSGEEEKERADEYKDRYEEEGNSRESSEEHAGKYINIKDISNGYGEVSQSQDLYDLAEVDANEILILKKLPDKFKRSVEFASSNKNQLTAYEEQSQKYDKSFKQRLLKGALESNVSELYLKRQADTSEEYSSEESKEDKAAAAAAPVAGNLKPLEESVSRKSSRRRRDIEESPEEEHSAPDHDVNEVFIFSNEKPNPDYEEDFKVNDFKSPDPVYEKWKIFIENKNSEEDYAQGCGESDDNQDEHTSENSDENNETAFDKL